MYKDLRGVMVKSPYVVSPETPLQEALVYMQECNIRHLPVTIDDELVGVVSERDILSHIENDGSDELLVSDIMSRRPFSVNQSDSLASTVEIMAINKYGSVLVTDTDDSLVGIFTTTDALRLLQTLLERDPSFPMDEEVITLQQVVGWH